MKNHSAHVLLGLLLVMSGCTSDTTETTTPPPVAQIQNDPQDPNGMVSPMFQQICVEGKDQQGPWNNDLAIDWVNANGLTEGTSSTLAEASGVPTVIQDDNGRLIAAFQWFPCTEENAFDQVAVSISEDEGATWSDPTLIEIEDFPEGYQRPFDPTLALLPDGRIRIYYTSNAKGMTTFGDDTNIYSAISDDGIHYQFEEGARFDVDGEPVYDSAVGYWDGVWHLITPQRTETPYGAYHGTSTDGLTFEQQPNITLDEEMNWTGNFLAREDGLTFYGTADNNQGNWTTTTTDGETWSTPAYLGTHGGDPAVTCVSNGLCLVITVQMNKP